MYMFSHGQKYWHLWLIWSKKAVKINMHCNAFDLLFKNDKKSNLSLDNKNLKWGEISLWNKGFLKNTDTIIGTPRNSYG